MWARRHHARHEDRGSCACRAHAAPPSPPRNWTFTAVCAPATTPAWVASWTSRSTGSCALSVERLEEFTNPTCRSNSGKPSEPTRTGGTMPPCTKGRTKQRPSPITPTPTHQTRSMLALKAQTENAVLAAEGWIRPLRETLASPAQASSSVARGAGGVVPAIPRLGQPLRRRRARDAVGVFEGDRAAIYRCQVEPPRSFLGAAGGGRHTPDSDGTTRLLSVARPPRRHAFRSLPSHDAVNHGPRRSLRPGRWSEPPSGAHRNSGFGVQLN
jgi:hypothetical protein